MSQRRLAKKFKVHHSTICRQLAKLDIRCYKSEKTRKYTKEKSKISPELSRKLAILLYSSDCSVVIDDEKYFFFFRWDIHAWNDNFFGDDRAECPDDVHYVGLEKFPKKILVRVAISSLCFRDTFPPKKVLPLIRLPK